MSSGLRVNILIDFREGPWGGGNQFLKSLKNYFIQSGVYEEYPEKAHVILFNSHHKLIKALGLKRRYKDKIFVHRMDGPISVFRESMPTIDRIIYDFNQKLGDGTIFQSTWSRNENHRIGLIRKNFETVILNAPDPYIFNQKGRILFSRERKIRLINTSWSPNWNKGFKVYQWLDKNLDFSKYKMTFIGRSPLIFKNITWIEPQPSISLAEYLKQHDIFITASKNEACSNSLIEALHCGLPSIGLNEGGNPEIIGKRGELFNKAEDIPKILDRVIDNYKIYQSAIDLPDMDSTGKVYFDFFKRIYKKNHDSEYDIKKISKTMNIKLKMTYYKWKLENKVHRIKDILRSKI